MSGNPANRLVEKKEIDWRVFSPSHVLYEHKSSKYTPTSLTTHSGVPEGFRGSGNECCQMDIHGGWVDCAKEAFCHILYVFLVIFRTQNIKKIGALSPPPPDKRAVLSILMEEIPKLLTKQ